MPGGSQQSDFSPDRIRRLHAALAAHWAQSHRTKFTNDKFAAACRVSRSAVERWRSYTSEHRPQRGGSQELRLLELEANMERLGYL